MIVVPGPAGDLMSPKKYAQQFGCGCGAKPGESCRPGDQHKARRKREQAWERSTKRTRKLKTPGVKGEQRSESVRAITTGFEIEAAEALALALSTATPAGRT